jgi:hypothetical protein
MQKLSTIRNFVEMIRSVRIDSYMRFRFVKIDSKLVEKLVEDGSTAVVAVIDDCDTHEMAEIIMYVMQQPTGDFGRQQVDRCTCRRFSCRAATEKVILFVRLFVSLGFCDRSFYRF